MDFCLGAGFELALACDIRIASLIAKFGLPEIKLGILPGGGGTVRLSRLAGASIANALALTGETITAERAFALGILHSVHEPDALPEAAATIAERLASYSPYALRQLKSVLNASANADMEGARDRNQVLCLVLLNRGPKGRGAGISGKACATLFRSLMIAAAARIRADNLTGGRSWCRGILSHNRKTSMFEISQRAKDVKARLEAFMDRYVYPNEARYFRESETVGAWGVQPVIEELKPLARAEGLWNLFLPELDEGAGLSNLEYAPLCEVMGRTHLAPEVFNCSAPDTGNMEVLARYGTPEQQEQWLKPLLAGEIRSSFAMTEPAVASSDATNIESLIRREGNEYVINGRKWYTTGATDPRCKIIIFMGKTDAANPDRYRQQSMVLVPKDTPGVNVIRSIPVFGFYGVPDRAAEVEFDNVRVPVSNILLGEGRGFEIAQGRLGPGRVHHCMRLIGLAERSLERMCVRAQERVAFGKPVADQTVTQERIAESRILIEQSRLLTLKAAYMMDTVGNKAARTEIAMIKVAVPNMACRVIDWAIQVHGGGGTSNDFGLASAYAIARILRIADGPDEVHRNQIARLELRKHANAKVTELPRVKLVGAAT